MLLDFQKELFFACYDVNKGGVAFSNHISRKWNMFHSKLKTSKNKISEKIFHVLGCAKSGRGENVLLVTGILLPEPERKCFHTPLRDFLPPLNQLHQRLPGAR